LLLEKAKVEPDESIIGAACQKNFSGKRIEVLFGLMLIGICSIC